MTNLKTAARLTYAMLDAIERGDETAAHKASRKVMQTIADDFCEVSTRWSRAGFPDDAIAAVAQGFASTLFGVLPPDHLEIANAILRYITVIGINVRRPKS